MPRWLHNVGMMPRWKMQARDVRGGRTCTGDLPLRRKLARGASKTHHSSRSQNLPQTNYSKWIQPNWHKNWSAQNQCWTGKLRTACPKSIKRISPLLSKIFSREMSRWQMPCLWRKDTACSNCQDHKRMRSFVGWRWEIMPNKSPPSACSKTSQTSSSRWNATNISKMYSGICSQCLK